MVTALRPRHGWAVSNLMDSLPPSFPSALCRFGCVDRGTGFLDTAISASKVRLRRRSRDPEGFHTVGQGGGLEPEKTGGAAAAVNLPARPGDRPLDGVPPSAN